MGRTKKIDTGKRTLDIFLLYLVMQFGRYLATDGWHGGFVITWFDVLIGVIMAWLILTIYSQKTK